MKSLFIIISCFLKKGYLIWKNIKVIIASNDVSENKKLVVSDTFKNKIFNKFKNIIKLKIEFLKGFELFFFEKLIILSFLFLNIDEYIMFQNISIYVYINKNIKLKKKKFKFITLY